MTNRAFTVFLVDDDEGALKALARLLRVRGYLVQAHLSPLDFLRSHDTETPGCAVLDMSMPGLNGLELQQALTAGGVQRPVIFLTGEGDIPTSVRAMQAGAIDFLTKPVSEVDIIAAICRAEQEDARIRSAAAEIETIKTKLSELTPREYEVMTHVIAGRLNKQIAGDLGTVEKTIKVHRARMLEKLGTRSIPDLVRLAAKVGVSIK